MRTSAKVAVIGAGAAGLAAVREAVREGHRVTCYEVSSGGRPITWSSGSRWAVCGIWLVRSEKSLMAIYLVLASPTALTCIGSY